MDGTDLKDEFRKLLRASGWTQAEAARQLAMTPSALSQIVRANSPVRPSPVTLRLFRLLLLRDKSPAPPPRPQQWEKDLIRALRHLPPRRRRAVLGALEALMAKARKKGRDAPVARRAKTGG